MTARLVDPLAALPALVALFALAALVACGPRTEGLDPLKLPEDVRGDYDVFARRCSKCHGLSRPLQSGISDDEQWTLYVRRMRRQPGSGISADDEKIVLRFLRYYAAETRKAKAEKSAPAPSSPAPSPPSPVAPVTTEGGAP